MQRLTEDEVRKKASHILGLDGVIDDVQIGTGQLTTFNNLGFKGIIDKPDGWYLPQNTALPALILETKSTSIELGKKQIDELLKNIQIAQTKYDNVIGILYNGLDVICYKNLTRTTVSDQLQSTKYYLDLFKRNTINKERIYQLTAKINNTLHFNFGIKNLYQRMIFTACALVAQRYGGHIERLQNLGYNTFRTGVFDTLSKSLEKNSSAQNGKVDLLLDEYASIKMNITDNQDAINNFIDNVVEISKNINSNEWNGEDVMGIFFNEFNRYKKKSENGQIFTSEHITDFMYKVLDTNKTDYVLDATCGSGGFLVKAMANMIHEAGGMETNEAKDIKTNHLYGIEWDREIYSLACANMLIHKDGHSNLERMDSRSDKAVDWIKSKPITKVLMNPPYENKYGCMKIVENVLNSVKSGTQCAFILPDKKLEKASKRQMNRILKHHRLIKIMKFPEDLFFGVSTTTSLFIFEAGKSQDGQEIFACYMKDDGLVTVKNKGRHDVYGKWADIEKYWLNVMYKQSGDDTCQWINPKEHLSYQIPQKPFEILEEDFKKTALDYIMFEHGIDANDFNDKLMDKVLYSSNVKDIGNNTVAIELKRGSQNE